MKTFKILLPAFLVLIAMQVEAAWCKRCRANFMGRGEYCSRCKAIPEVKELLKAEDARKKQKAVMEKPLGMKSFLGFNFLSQGQPSSVVTQKLEKAFRGFTDVQLHYSSLGRLMKIQLTDSVPGRRAEDIETELNALSSILERKYKFTFPKPLSCNSGFTVVGGGWSSPTSRKQIRRQLIHHEFITWHRNMAWKDFALSLSGCRPNAEYSPSEVTHIDVSFEMLGVRDSDAKKKVDAGKNDLDGLDRL